MRNTKKRWFSVFAACCICVIVLIMTAIFSDGKAGPEAKIQEYADSINSGDIDRYIKLFTLDNQGEMKDYLDFWGAEKFFRKENIAIKNVKQLSDSVGRRSSAISDDEISKYDAVTVYYTDMMVQTKQSSDELMKSGHQFPNFVFIKESGEWKILRISSPNLKLTIEAGEGFHTIEEQEALARKEALYRRPVQELKLWVRKIQNGYRT